MELDVQYIQFQKEIIYSSIYQLLNEKNFDLCTHKINHGVQNVTLTFKVKVQGPVANTS